MSLSEQSRGLFHCWVRHFSNSCQQTRKIICSFKYPGKNAGKLWRADWYSMKSGRVTSLSGSRTRALSHHQHSQLENTTACKVGGGRFLCGHRRSETHDCKQAGGRTYSEVRDVTSELGQPAAFPAVVTEKLLMLAQHKSSIAGLLISVPELKPRKSDPTPHLYSINSLMTAAISLTEG